MEFVKFYAYWGKTAEDGRYHLLPYHCLDVAAVAAAWWNASFAIRHRFCQGQDETRIRAWLLFFCALHDYGKFDLRFQLKSHPAFKQLYGFSDGILPSKNESKDYWHGEAGLYWFHNDILELFGEGDTGDSLFVDENDPEQWAAFKPWIEAVTGHHGHLKNADYLRDLSFSSQVDDRYASIDFKSRVAWLYALEKLFLTPAGLSMTSEPPCLSSYQAVFLAGFCSVADWLGSRCDDTDFSFLETPQDLQSYFEGKIAADAQRVLQLSGLIGQPKSFSGVAALLPAGKPPRPLQCLTENLPANPSLTIIEAPTGNGKTEAALAHAWKIVDSGLAEAIIFALPTQATANAMFGRLEKAAKILFADSPNLLLAHGFARFNEPFAELKKRGRVEDGDEQDGWVKCSEWLAESRKRVFLGQIGVCTIDQVLISVLPVRHRFVRGFGVGRSVLIVDEVHAYDAYMYGLLEEVLRQQRASGGSAILLSATLPFHQKQHLFSAWDSDLPESRERDSYPLISCATNREVLPLSLAEDDEPDPLTVNVECVRFDGMVPDASLIERLIAAAAAGAQVAVICNLVDVAQNLYEQLKKQAKEASITVDLFHARFRFLDRQVKEQSVIHTFGLNGNRKKGRILVATQVVEQSLDVDFDWIITQLCPIDLLFQRMGRLHRHEINDATRPAAFSKRLCTVVLPTDDDYGGTAVVYGNKRVLWRTEQILAESEQIVFPVAYRTQIEKAYQQEPWPYEPEEITEANREFEDEIYIKGYKARQAVNMARDSNPFVDSDESITAVTRDGEMSLTVIPYLDSDAGRRTLDGDLLDSLDEYRLLEILALNSINVPGTGGWKGALKDVPLGEDKRYWLNMQPTREGFIAEGIQTIFRYHRDTGLRREKK
ncbi:CRISPR-associated helicase/endonuclease Cas3 [Desulfuromonas acetoxidans]|uniref:CRISPR-associated helicase Cas3, core n=1 Tax=Desulfuromonas acetoxidans (strain DSM 684 / 11070) TaxID=281689 RepID=Q1JX05_DESA6|nr:CRISPR-associated helicase/endonuclease Cas3 [Desulfuromonas acetoxidans]EAT14753.1 CRISPR-associated helicase Cas3, core [Desulfuromonas acetoxidans DSM 684]MBF0646968.1 CRISPR-associated helicase/endonuclease Cas3 [Desulfuromonas acetoxidans]NVD25006.1 CRISPR-associated helicase/endonuclease Cas3 [Desulfuromonas acetoxidans]NVE17051.1 CRISPR-associated helicase/endonuclease Cas3 [Desulfuromonas acetoxidans]